MSIIQKPFDPQVHLPAMFALGLAHPARSIHYIDLPYRLSSPSLQDPGNVGIWCDPGGALIGWAALQFQFWTLDFAVHPLFEKEFFAAMLPWFERQSGASAEERDLWFVNIFSEDHDRLQIFENAGFESQSDKGEDSWSKVWMVRSGTDPVPQFRIPSGFTIRPIKGAAEVPAYVDLHQTTFETKNMVIPWRMRTLTQPGYTPELDLVVETPQGTLGAFCICWTATLPDGKRVGQVEPLGCHPSFRNYALGRLALVEGLRRLVDLGMHEIFVETDNYRDTAFRLYESLGFTTTREILVLGKSLSKTP